MDRTDRLLEALEEHIDSLNLPEPKKTIYDYVRDVHLLGDGQYATSHDFDVLAEADDRRLIVHRMSGKIYAPPKDFAGLDQGIDVAGTGFTKGGSEERYRSGQWIEAR
jgi:hypothetical protein